MFVFLWSWQYVEHRGDGRASPRLQSRAVTRIGVLADARDSSFENFGNQALDGATRIAAMAPKARTAHQAGRAGRA